MLKKSSRRVFGLVVAALIASVAAAQPVPAAAPTNGTLLGAVGCQICNQSLDQIDPAGGTETAIASVGGVGVQAMVSDPASHLVYASAGYGGGKGGAPQAEMIRLDTQTGILTATPNAPVLPLAMALDPATHALFGVSYYVNGVFAALRIDPSTWAPTLLATLPSATASLALDPASHTLYTESFDYSVVPVTGRLFAINTQTGALSSGVILNPAVNNLVYDTASGALFGENDDSPGRFVHVNPTTGAESPVGSFTVTAGFANAAAIDSGSHTVYVVETAIASTGDRVSRIATINDQTGASALSPQTAEPVWAVTFQPLPITPQSIETDVKTALATSAIDNAGVANALLAQLDAAATARSGGQCTTAASIYTAFIDLLSAQSAKHVAAATAGQFTAEAEFLIANCP